MKYIKTKSSKVYKSNASHSEIMVYNHLRYDDILDEGYIVNGIMHSIHNLPDQLLKARIAESQYLYKSHNRIGD